MDGLPLWLKYLQAIALVIIPFVGAWIALGQLHVARIKLKHDLFDRRFTLYDQAANFISRIQLNDVQNWQTNEYARQMLDAEFLLNKEVKAYLDTLLKEANALRPYELTVKNTHSDITRVEAMAKVEEKREWFAAQPTVLKEKFLPLIGFEERRQIRSFAQWLDRMFE